MLKIGCHLSSSEGYEKMGSKIVELGGNTFQFFTRNPRGGNIKSLDKEDISRYNTFAKENGIDYIVGHAPYTYNLCSDKETNRIFALKAMREDLARLEFVDKVYYNFHPGSFVSLDVDTGINYIVEGLNKILKEDQKTIVLLETMAGKGSEIGRTFEEIKRIIDGVKLKHLLGVTLDTCHVFDGGYDIKNHLDDVLNEFDNIIGLDLLKAIHLNDSKNILGSHKDRHEKIGLGNIGSDALVNVINHPKLKNLPFVLETPNEDEGYKAEIAFLKSEYR